MQKSVVFHAFAINNWQITFKKQLHLQYHRKNKILKNNLKLLQNVCSENYNMSWKKIEKELHK